MKRLLLLTVAALMSLSLCACGDDDRNEPVVLPTLSTVGTTTSPTMSQTESSGTVTTTTSSPTKPSGTQQGTDPAPDTPQTPNVGDATKGEQIETVALSLLGKAFEDGGVGPDSFDNPRFVRYCYAQCGYSVPDSANGLLNYGVDVPDDALEVGDILIFGNDADPTAASFVGIYVGDNEFIAATNSQVGIKIHALDATYWGKLFIAARRPQA